MTKPAATKTRLPNNRRTFLNRAGAATLVTVVGGGVYRAADREVFSVGQGEAYELWETWREEQATGTMAFVESAILASNPHNSQPWLFRVSETQLDFNDPKRSIGSIDPFLRDDVHWPRLRARECGAHRSGTAPGCSSFPTLKTRPMSPTSSSRRGTRDPPNSTTPF